MSRFVIASFKAACLGLALFVLLVMASVNALAETASANSDTRSSTTLHFKSGGRDSSRNTPTGVKTVDQYNALETGGDRTTRPGNAPGKAELSAGVNSQSAVSNDFWIYDADVLLFADDDGDGYYYGIDLLFDADTLYSSADVYAAVYLSLDGGPWNEYAVTEDFTIFGTSATDEFVLVTELASGYPTGEYDLLIELFDAFDGAFLASFGPEDTSELAFLPLEDFNRDDPGFDVPVVVSSGGGGGAAGFLFLGMLGLILWRRDIPGKMGTFLF
ncbi:MAG: choice-of-anchor H family protein, partial [Gammaproteobacteria bacterium]|nr:choice-of-anchor H family protein [Gammaproteobacteria bacterium]